jgi:predicted nuclease of predicted toxin-antitoxin system
MIRLVADHNFNGRIVRGLRRRNAVLDIVRVQDVGLAAATDRVILDWAAREGRIVLTHDVTTMIGFAYQRVRHGEPMSGVIAMKKDVPIGRAIEDILLLAEATREDEWEHQVWHIPL